MARRERSLRRTNAVFAVACSLLAAGLPVSGFFLYKNYTEQARTQVGLQLSTASRLKADQLSQFRRERQSDAAFFEDNYAFFSLAERLFAEPGDSSNERMVREWLDGFKRMSLYDRILLLDARKAIRMSIPGSDEPLAAALSGPLEDILRSPRIVFMDFYRNEVTDLIHLGTFVPILDPSGRGPPIGVVVLRVDPHAFLYPFLAQWPAPSDSAETLLVRREGDEVVFLNDVRFDPDAALRHTQPIGANPISPAAMAVSGMEGMVEGVDYRGVPVIADIRAVPDSPWFLVAKMDRVEAFGPLRERLAATVLVAALFLAALGAGILWFRRRQDARHQLERAEAAEALSENERRYRTMFEALAEGVALHELVRGGDGTALDYRFLTVNPAFFTHLGRPAVPMEGITATVFFATEAAPYLEAYEKVVRTGEPCVFETYFPPLDRHFRISAVSPAPGQFATIFEDITDRLNRDKELQERNEEMARFTYTVSHDLRSPLVTVKTFLGYLEEDVARGDEERRKKDTAYIRTAAEKMTVLLDELLELSRAGRMKEPPTEFALRDAVGEALALTAGRIAARGVRIELAEEPVILRGERRRLVEVFQNLVDNAVKFMGDQPSPLVRIGAAAGDPPVLYVEDNGMGVDPRHKAKLFGLFEKLDPATEGVGMGLALAKRIVETHGGRIWAESEGVGRGTAFRFTLPGTRIGSGREDSP